MDMIKNAGVGVAMGNALTELKEVSDYVTISNNDNGFIKSIITPAKLNALVISYFSPIKLANNNTKDIIDALTTDTLNPHK